MNLPFSLVLFLTTAAGTVVRAQGLPAARPASVGVASSDLTRVSSALQAYVDSGKVAGLVALVARHGRVVYSRAFGRMDIARNVPMHMDAVFRIYSMTKPVIAVALMQQVERGRIRLDDPVSKYIPAFASVRVYAGGPATKPALRAPDTPVTIEHLLTHTAGLTYGVFGQTPVDSIYRRANLLDETRTLEQFADSIARIPLTFSPGEAWNYSMAFDVLARVVEVSSGRSLDRYLEEEIFAPLGMRDTGFHVRPSMDGRIPVLYVRSQNAGLRPDTPLVAPWYHATSRLFSGGRGLLSTPADYMRFAQMLLNGGELEGRRVLTRASVDAMMRNHLPPRLTPIVSPIVGHSGYGYGYGGAVLVDSALDQLPGSPGIYRWWGLMGTFFWIDPEADLIGMVWTQLSPGRAWPLEQDFQRLVYTAIRPTR